mgnify:CR=1 FL=1
MSGQPPGKKRGMWRSFFFPVAVLLLLVALAAFLIWQANCQQGPSVMGQLRQITGNSVTVGKEESDFYRLMAQRAMEQQGSQATDSGDAAAYASKVYARFLVGERLGICGPYSYESLQMEMEQENQDRKSRKEQGEKLEGPLQFELTDYLPYRLEQLEEASVEKLIENPSSVLLANSRSYWEINREQFAVIREVQVDMTSDGKTTQRTFKKSDLKEMKESNPQLYELLSEAREGQAFAYEYDGETIEGKVLSVKKETAAYEEVTQQVLFSYMKSVEYPQLISLVAQNNPVQLTE